MIDIEILKNVLETLVLIASIIASLFTFYKLIRKYIVDKIKAKVTNFLNKHYFSKIEDITNTLENIKKTVGEDILPVINSFKHEFTANSGKSIKDQITRIDYGIQFSEFKSKMLAENVPDKAMYELSPSGECIWANTSMTELLGLSKEEILGNGWMVAISDDEKSEIWEHLEKLIKNNIPFNVRFCVYNQKSGESFLVRIIIKSCKSTNGTILGFFGFMERIGEC